VLVDGLLVEGVELRDLGGSTGEGDVGAVSTSP
jgi:hypothetical protein